MTMVKENVMVFKENDNNSNKITTAVNMLRTKKQYIDPVDTKPCVNP